MLFYNILYSIHLSIHPSIHLPTHPLTPPPYLCAKVHLILSCTRQYLHKTKITRARFKGGNLPPITGFYGDSSYGAGKQDTPLIAPLIPPMDRLDPVLVKSMWIGRFNWFLWEKGEPILIWLNGCPLDRIPSEGAGGRGGGLVLVHLLCWDMWAQAQSQSFLLWYYTRSRVLAVMEIFFSTYYLCFFF